MKACAFVFLFVFCYAECRKTYAPIDKNANLAFINMEGGGVKPAAPPAKVPQPIATPASDKATNSPPLRVTTHKPSYPTPPLKPIVAPVTPPAQVKPQPVKYTPVVNPVTTPGPGSVKQLVSFYDSQGKASPIRPYSYSQAVKQG